MDTAIPSDRPSAVAPDNPSAERWVTLRELAEIRGISQHSAARLVRRHRWRRQTDNQGHVRALIPAEALDRPGVMPPDSPSAGPDVAAALQAAFAAALAAKDETIAVLQARAERADKAEARAGEAEKALVAERTRADQAEITADRLETELEAEKIARAEAEADAAELRQLEAERRRKALWARLRAAWRGE